MENKISSTVTAPVELKLKASRVFLALKECKFDDEVISGNKLALSALELFKSLLYLSNNYDVKYKLIGNNDSATLVGHSVDIFSLLDENISKAKKSSLKEFAFTELAFHNLNYCIQFQKFERNSDIESIFISVNILLDNVFEFIKIKS